MMYQNFIKFFITSKIKTALSGGFRFSDPAAFII